VLCHFEFDAKNRILRCRFDGRVTDEALKEWYRLAAEYVAQTDPRAAVFDLSAVTSFDVSAEIIRELAKSAPVVPDPSRSRCIVAPSPKIFGMMRMFEIEGEATRPNWHMVHTQQEAWAILGVEGSQSKPL
jgi:hypothetical protein